MQVEDLAVASPAQQFRGVEWCVMEPASPGNRAAPHFLDSVLRSQSTLKILAAEMFRAPVPDTIYYLRRN
jgi:hypothetical protein